MTNISAPTSLHPPGILKVDQQRPGPPMHERGFTGMTTYEWYHHQWTVGVVRLKAPISTDYKAGSDVQLIEIGRNLNYHQAYLVDRN